MTESFDPFDLDEPFRAAWRAYEAVAPLFVAYEQAASGRTPPSEAYRTLCWAATICQNCGSPTEGQMCDLIVPCWLPRVRLNSMDGTFERESPLLVSRSDGPATWFRAAYAGLCWLLHDWAREIESVGDFNRGANTDLGAIDELVSRSKALHDVVLKRERNVCLWLH